MSNSMRMRWGDNDRYFGPFTYAPPSKQGYNSLSLILGSGDGDERPGCRLRVSGFGHTLIVALPAIVKPDRRWVDTSHYEWSKEPGSGFWDYNAREYGFSYSEGFLNISLGRVTHDSSTEQRKGYFLPWTQWRFVRHSLYGLDGGLFAHLPANYRWGTPERDEHERLEATCPLAHFAFDDFDGERLIASTKIEEREWLFGTGGFKWLSLFRKPKVRRSLDLSFSGETGRRKGSWKGGTIGTGIDMLPRELHASAFERYCAGHEMTFAGVSGPPPEVAPVPPAGDGEARQATACGRPNQKAPPQ